MSDGFYRAFEERFRGSRALIKSRLQIYLPFVEPLLTHYPAGQAIDLGCGRGEWLELLREHGVSAHGVDLDAGMLGACEELGLSVERGDAIEALKRLPDASRIVVSGFHVAEHLPFAVLQELVEEAFRVLAPGGLLILETPNAENIVVGASMFYQDPSHVHPLPSVLLQFLPEYYGFVKSKILRLQEAPDLHLQNRAAVLDVLAGVSPDYAVVAQKNADAAILAATEPAFAKEYGMGLEVLASRFDQFSERRAARFEAEMARLDAETARLDAEKARLDANTVRLEAERARLQADIVRLDAGLRQTIDRLSQLEAQARQADERAQQFELRAQQADHRIMSLLAQLEQLYQSTSWRVTRPLRSARALASAVKRVLKRSLHRLRTRAPAQGPASAAAQPNAPAPGVSGGTELSHLPPHARQVYLGLTAALDAQARKDPECE
jgi:O-antigen chain-terminating methyltransferase